MNRDIKYTGLYTATSEYNCPDGELAFALNVVNEDDALHPIRPPVRLFSIGPHEKVLYVHKVDGIPHFIISHTTSEGTLELRWCEAGGPPQGLPESPIICTCSAVRDITSVGNTIAISTDEGLVFALWRDDTYIFLGSKPVLPAFSFGLDLAGEFKGFTSDIPCDPDTYHAVRDALPDENRASAGASRPHGSPADAQNLADDFFQSVSDAIYGHIFDQYTRLTDDNGMLFYQPFFVRYAFRLFDGSYSWHSAPVLMLPTTIPPQVTSGTGTYADNTYHFAAQVNLNYFRLLFSTIRPGNLSLWKDVITHVDVFISAPLYTFDQSKSVLGYGKDGYIKTKQIVLPGERNDRGRDHNTSTTIATTRRLLGIYRDGGSPGNFQRHFLESEAPHWLIPTRESELLEDVRSTHLFYRIARIAPADIPAPASGFTPLPVEDGVSPKVLLARPTLPDEFGSHHTLFPDVLHSYNSRLHIADIDVALAAPQPLEALVCADAPRPASDPGFTPAITYRKNGSSVESVRSSYGPAGDSIPAPDHTPPVFIYVHDADASFLTLYTEEAPDEARGIDIPLTPHDFLNGAYWFSGFDFPADTEATPLFSYFNSGTPVPPPHQSHLRKRSTIYVSEVNNPLVFPATLALAVGDGRVCALASAAKALSQGQFGQYPLYAFTDAGIWALELSAKGSYSARQPISRDVILDGSHPLQIDSAVLFASRRGIMIIAGSQLQCISDSISSDTPFSLEPLPRIDKIHEMLGHGADGCIPLEPFLSFIKSARMLYDYVRQRIIVFSPQSPCAYVFSLKSRLWSMMHSALQYTLNAYPEAMAVEADGSVVIFSQKQTDVPQPPAPTPALIVSRPLALGAPDILKTVDTFIQRGHFRRGHVQSVLYASRDLFNWHLVWSSIDHYLRGFRGSPYKYFRIALLCNLLPDESISGASVQFSTRLTNQPR
ncbi:MAG: hypothetical protein K2M06_07060 [Muribaculaceae bacterium]|nr:hypothetical protein [Muribaculaceae bacterium]